jgi:hypothetical protein
MIFPGFASESALYRQRRSYGVRPVHNQVTIDAVVPQLPVDPLSSACCRFCALSRLCCMDDSGYCLCVPCGSEAVVEQPIRRGY